ncbi:MAG TPA: dTDP-4-dehydrorhamnose reductase [Vicinamibacterales bacterium]|nr:dTDP-4-dehydrorhamnose reductase [Vicinamibacterales bacterium]
MRVLVTGAAGLLGAAVIREFTRDADVLPLDRRALDITDDAAVGAAIREHRPDVVVNCAAYNDVDGAQGEPALALRANAFAVLALGRSAAAAGATFVHYSSDFVFDGESDRPYFEEDRANPRSVYGSSKLLGDWFAMEGPRAYVLRVESLFGPAGAAGTRRGSLGTIVDRIVAGEEVPVFVDRVVSPSFTPDIARATRALVEREAAPGLYHCVNSGHATWAEIAERAASCLGRPLRVRPLTLASARLRAPRPRYCALSNAKLRAAGIEMGPWEEALEAFLTTRP